MNSYAPTARPLNAAIAWATKDAIFCEMPTKDGPPFIIRERKTIEGLSRVLGILIEHQEAAPRSVPKDHPKIERKPPASKAPWATESDRAKVQGILRRLKIT